MEYVPGVTATTCDEVVAPLPHANATGATPPVEDAVHVMLLTDGVPTHVTASAEAACTIVSENANAIPTMATAALVFANVINNVFINLTY